MQEQEYIYKVLIRCFTYNHSLYIREALSGFVRQKTKFPFIIALVDDASTDNEQEVIQKYIQQEFYYDSDIDIDETEYAKIIRGKHKDNTNCSIVAYLLKYNHHTIRKPKMQYLSELRDCCKFEAICEGDDYWIDQFKLQKQVDVLDSDSNLGFCYTAGYINENNRLIKKNGIVTSNEDIYGQLLYGNFIITASVLIEMNALRQALDNIRSYGRRWFMGDYPLWLELASFTNSKYIDDYTCVYRILEESASHSKNIEKVDRLYKAACDIQNFYAAKRGYNSMKIYFEANYYAKMYQCALETNNNPEIYRNYLATIKSYSSSKIFVLSIASRYRFIEYFLKFALNSVLLKRLRSLF